MQSNLAILQFMRIKYSKRMIGFKSILKKYSLSADELCKIASDNNWQTCPHAPPLYFYLSVVTAYFNKTK